MGQDETARDLIDGDVNSELASHRTSLTFERTRMSSDRTLMSTVRTSLSLISFGFTIHQVFAKSQIFPKADDSGRNLGLALLAMGVALLAGGIIGHALFDRALCDRRNRLHDMGLLRRQAEHHATPTYLVALALLIVGVTTLVSVAWRLLARAL